MAEDIMNILFKIPVLGPFGCGKSTILDRLITNTLPTDYVVQNSTTISMKLSEMPLCTYEFWDCPGKPLVDMTDSALDKSHGAVIVVEITDKKLLSHIDTLYNQIVKYRQKNNYQNIIYPILILVNKIDLASKNKQKRANEIIPTWIQRNNKKGIRYVLCSAKTDVNINKSFKALLKELYAVRRQLRPMKLPFEPSPSYKELLNQNDVYNFYERNGGNDDDEEDEEYDEYDENNSNNNNNDTTVMENTVMEVKKDNNNNDNNENGNSGDVKKLPNPEDGNDNIKITPRIGTTVKESDMHTPNPDLDFKKSVHLESPKTLNNNQQPPPPPK